MADTRKHDPVTDEAPLALYCFPEIASGGKPSMMYRSQTPFIGGSTRPAKIVMTPLVAEARADEPKSVDAADANETVDAKAPGPDIQALEAAAFDKGLEQGRAETAQELRETVENTVSALNTALASLEQVHRQSLQSMETEAVRLAIAIAKKIIGSESDKALVIQHVVRTAMEKVTNPRHLVLRLNPADMDAITAVKSKLIADDADMTLNLQPDTAIQRGGCIIETQLGDVDARIDQQIKMIETLLTDKLSQSAHEN